jgi:MFS family permease
MLFLTLLCMGLAWGWRVPFLLRLLLVVVGLQMRRTIGESPAFSQLKRDDAAARRPVLEALRKHPRAVLLGAGTRAAEAGFISIVTTFILGYAVQTVGLPRPAAQLFPARVRSSGTSLGFQVGGVLAGALSPVIAAAMVAASGSLWPVGVYMLALGLISIASVALAQCPARRLNRVVVPG